MDPQTTLYEMLRELAAEEPDRDQIAEQLESLLEWIERGGHLPQIGRLNCAFIVRKYRENVVSEALPPKPF